jgi:hypothetical protein
MIYSGSKTVTTHGVPEALTATAPSVMCHWITVQARPENSKAIAVGGPTSSYVSATAGAEKGIVLQNGDAHTFLAVPTRLYIDLNHIFVDVLNDGDGVTYVYGRA